jgi:hypothetical protein
MVIENVSWQRKTNQAAPAARLKLLPDFRVAIGWNFAAGIVAGFFAQTLG